MQRLTLDKNYVADGGELVGATTIKKEVATLGSIWNWGMDTGRLTGPFPRKGLRLPKTDEKPRFGPETRSKGDREWCR